MLRGSCFSTLLLAAVFVASACSDSSDGNNGAAGASAGGTAGAGATPEKLTRALATSASHTCVLRRAGLFCWGANDKGQLGDESTTSTTTPVKAKLDATDVVELALRTGGSCVRKRSGKVSCWGTNASAQLGDSTHSDSLTPVEVKLDAAKQLALDETTGCALRADGSVWCWGGSPESEPDSGSLEPAAVEGIDGALELRSGQMSTYCARGQSWTRCWRLEAGAWTTPTDVPGLAAASGIALASGQEVCGIVEGGEVVCNEVSGGGSSARLSGSRGTNQLAGGLLTLCGGDVVGAWYCWNILSPAVLQTIGAPRRELARGPFVELATAGYRYCGLGPGGEVQCMESNAPSAQFATISDLPD